MNSDTGEIAEVKDIPAEDKDAAGNIKPPWIPLIPGRVKSLTALSTRERIAWAAKENAKIQRKAKRQAQRDARKRQR